ncbi:hypothetical protein MUK42_36819 [Musa troglodytarum]|uniref:Uncharacterized protein n=1 Tax=Musa troglodytarum TaxID=320322 RepID=A0A9E7ECP6_9LILI|nr:hypothetical protein MUK42_36819 [Musa troglodytarum]
MTRLPLDLRWMAPTIRGLFRQCSTPLPLKPERRQTGWSQATRSRAGEYGEEGGTVSSSYVGEGWHADDPRRVAHDPNYWLRLVGGIVAFETNILPCWNLMFSIIDKNASPYGREVCMPFVTLVLAFEDSSARKGNRVNGLRSSFVMKRIQENNRRGSKDVSSQRLPRN